MSSRVNQKMKFYTPFRTLLLVLLLTGIQISFAAEEDVYRIGREDILDISVWESKDLTQTVEVSSEGTITYPILGKLLVAGLKPEEVAENIRGKLAEGYVKEPKVTVVVREYNSKKILVFGEVEKPGLYKLKKKIPLLELLLMVGGVRSDAKRMTVIRPLNVEGDATPAALKATPEEGASQESAKTIDVSLIALLTRGDLSQNIQIIPGDTIYVASGSGERFYVMGQVKNPGPIEWVQDVTLLEAIKMADGATPRAALNRITVRQSRGGQEQVIKVNLADIMNGKKKDDVIIKPGDVIIVPESWI
jgi:polysaccharide export outer membrane protein